MASAFDGFDWQRWKWPLVLLGVFVGLLHQAVAGSCGDDDDRYQRHKSNDCWYELWYFWFIVVLVFITIVVLVIFYCKQQVKRSTGRRGRRLTPVLTMPVAPPPYEAPGHEPPPYHIAMSTANAAGPPDPSSACHGEAQLPGCPAARHAGRAHQQQQRAPYPILAPPTVQCNTHGHASPPRAGQRPAALPGYVVRPQDPNAYGDNLSWPSTVSMGAISNPPPYSPPHSAYRNSRYPQPDVHL